MKKTKTLIEVALPLEAINKAAAREKAIRHGHSTQRQPTTTGENTPICSSYYPEWST